MAGLWYRVGTVTVTNGSKKVTGFGSLWKTGTLKPDKGHAFYGPDGKAMEVDYVESDTVLYLVKAYSGSTASGQAYEIDITRTSTIPAFSREVSALLAHTQGQFDSWQSILTGSGDVTLTAPDGQQVTVPALSSMLSKSGNLAGLGNVATARRNLGISAFADTLLDDADAAAMRATLATPGLSVNNTLTGRQIGPFFGSAAAEGITYSGPAAISLGTVPGVVELTIFASIKNGNIYGTTVAVVHVHMLGGYPGTNWAPSFNVVTNISKSQNGPGPTLTFASSVQNIINVTMSGTGNVVYSYATRRLSYGHGY